MILAAIHICTGFQSSCMMLSVGMSSWYDQSVNLNTKRLLLHLMKVYLYQEIISIINVMEYYNIKTLSRKETMTSATKNLVAINI